MTIIPIDPAIFICCIVIILMTELMVAVLFYENIAIIKLGLMDLMESMCDHLENWTNNFYDKYYSCRPGEREWMSA